MKAKIIIISVFISSLFSFKNDKDSPLVKEVRVKKVLAIQNNLSYGYSNGDLKSASFALDIIDNVEETGQRKKVLNKQLYQNFGMFHTIEHDRFDEINNKLKLKIKDRNDLTGIPDPLTEQTISALQKELNIDFVQVIEITAKDNGKYFFILNQLFWKNLRGRNPYVEVLSDHEILALTKFRLYDDYETCLAAILLILDTQTQLNRQACENLYELLSEQVTKAGLNYLRDSKFNETFDGSCSRKMIEVDGYGTREENLSKKLELVKNDHKESLAYYSALFSKLETKPFYIIKILN